MSSLEQLKIGRKYSGNVKAFMLLQTAADLVSINHIDSTEGGTEWNWLRQAPRNVIQPCPANIVSFGEPMLAKPFCWAVPWNLK